MDRISKKQKRLVIFTIFAYVALILLCAQGLWQRDINTLQPIFVLNIGVEIFGMLTGYVLFICCLIDVQKNGSELRYFIYMINLSFLGMFTDALAWLMEGMPEMRISNILDNTLLYMCAPLSAYCFWKYVARVVSMKRPFEKVFEKFVYFGLVISLLMRIVNLFTGWYFTVGADGVYHRGPFYSLSMLYSVLVLLAVMIVVIVERKQLQTYQIVAVMLYIITPFLAAVLTVTIYGLSVSNAIVMLTLLLMYCILNVSQGREKAAADRDLAVASSIQENILPRIFPYLPERKEFDLYATMTPAKEVGGDFYDFFMIDDDHIAIVIADVSGKGMPAALFMMVARTLIKNQAQGASYSRDPKDILAEVNNHLCEGNEMEMFVTAWLGIITLSTGRLEYASAGHEYPALSRAGHDFMLLVEKNSPPLAAMEGLRFRGGDIDLEPGDEIYVYTDGVTEATNVSNELFGIDRMLEALNTDRDAELDQIDTNVRDSISRFVGDAPQFDDITMLIFRYNGNN